MEFTELMEMVSTRDSDAIDFDVEFDAATPVEKTAYFSGERNPNDPILALIVDDSEADRVLLQHYINQTGEAIHVVQCRDLEDAFEQLSQQPIDIVLLDYLLPEGVLGPEHIPELRSVARNRHLPIVVLTGYGDERKAADAFKDGASDYLSKNDISPGSIYRSISNALEKANLERQVEHNRAVIMQTNRTLRQQNAQIRSFYQTVSHELKSPLAGAKEFTSLVLDGIGGEINEKQETWLKYANQCWDTLNRLIDDLLDSAAIENGKLRIEPEVSDIDNIARQCLRRYQISAKRKDIELNYTCSAASSVLMCDPLRIEQLMSNLLSNAIKATPEGGNIAFTLESDASGKMLSIAVKDTGCGIPKDKLLDVFEKFHQLDSDAGTGGKQPGMGLGLFLCKTIVELHGGEIVVRSEPGKGSEFRAMLPIKSTIEEAK